VAHALQKYAYKNANALSTISDDMKKTIVNRFGIDKDKIKVIYNWGHEELRANPLSENVFLKRFPKKDEETRVVYAGNLGKMQNVELILQTAARMKEYEDISFYIVGSGVNEENLKKYAREHELGNMKFVGMQPPEDVADLYQAADINVIPLQGGLIYAALPSKTADCLIAHKPIITCVDEESGFADIVKKFGFINTSPENPDALKNAIIQVAEKKRKMGDFSLLHALFDRDKNVTKYCDIIEKM
jgi:glycosyltransferase involved in cell wall biosynthesis